MPLDFTAVMTKIGQGIVRELQAKMFLQTGTDGGKYGTLKPETVRQKQKISAATADLRMIRTKDFVDNAFQSEPVSNGVRVFVSDGKHGRTIKALTRTLTKYKKLGLKGKVKSQAFKVAKASVAAPSYKEIAGYQLSEKSQFFPATDTEVFNLESVREGFEDFSQEADKQMRDLAEVHFSTVLNV